MHRCPGGAGIACGRDHHGGAAARTHVNLRLPCTADQQDGLKAVLAARDPDFVDQLPLRTKAQDFGKLGDEYSNFCNGIVKVQKDYYYGYYDKKGNEIVPCKYHRIWQFNDGRAIVEKNDILDFVRKHIDIIENDMKSSLKIKKEEASKQLPGKRAPVSTLAGAARSITKTHVKYTLKFD